MGSIDWENTVISADDVECDRECSQGSLLQIHPAQVGNGLISLPDGPFTIGRDDKCDITLADSAVSRWHATIERGDNGYILTDGDSTNGTIVNDRRTMEHLLNSGDKIRFGNFIFKYLDENEIESQYHETVYQMATCDGLTGVFNKRFFNESLEREFERSQHHSRDLTLILFDLDHFKSVNDNHGHLAGDEVLQQTAKRIQAVLHGDEVLARYGGEEFAIILGEVSIADAEVTAEKCRETIETQPYDTNVGPIYATISVGVADAKGCDTASALVEAADECLYRAKNLGRNQVRSTTEEMSSTS